MQSHPFIVYVSQKDDSILLFLSSSSSSPSFSLPSFLHPSSQDEPDPFYDLEQHALLGVANIYVEALHHDVRHEYDAPIIAPTGKVRNVMSGCLNVSHDQWRSQVISIGQALAPLLLCVDDISCHMSQPSTIALTSLVLMHASCEIA